MNRKIGFIPARKGSKGVKKKNIRLLNGKPLVAYAIETALASKELNEVYITTDDKDIISIAKEYGVGYIARPSHLANDKAKMHEVVEHALLEVAKSVTANDTLTLLQPTCPFRISSDIDESIRLLYEYCDDGAEAVVGVHEALHMHPERFYKVKNKKLINIMPEYKGLNRQDLPTFYIRNGVIYTIFINTFREHKCFSPDNSIPLIVPESRALNIDEEEDFAYAEYKLLRDSKSA